MSNHEEDYKLLIVLRAVNAYYSMTGEYQDGICGRLISFYSHMHVNMNSRVVDKIERMMASWPEGSGSENTQLM